MVLIDWLFRGTAWVIAGVYSLTSSYALAIIGLTVVVRLILFPLTAKQVRSMQAMAAAQPEIKKLQEAYKDDRVVLNTKMMEFYKENGINPAAGCFPLLLQAPFLITLYNVIYGLTEIKPLRGLMIRVPQPKYLDHESALYRSLVRSGGKMISWTVDLSQTAAGFEGTVAKRLPYYLLVVLVAVTGIMQQYQTMRKSPPANEQAAQMQRIMKFLPILFAVFAYNVKAGVVVYWIAGNIWTMAQTAFLYRASAPKPVIGGVTIDLAERAAAAAAASAAAPAKGAVKPGAKAVSPKAGSKAISAKAKAAAEKGTNGTPKSNGESKAKNNGMKPTVPRRPTEPQQPTKKSKKA
jgi:YidC/Oxa1 family membrane protein insertase